MIKRAKLNLGDLAGSEKINKDEEMQAKHMLELRNINLSLTTLGKVIQFLSTGGNSGNSAVPHIPFRESKLTRLLQDSIGGNTSNILSCNSVSINRLSGRNDFHFEICGPCQEHSPKS